MVKRTSSATRNLPRRSSARSIGLELMMDCQNEDLSPAQLQHMKKCRLEFDNAMAMIKAAQAKARAGKATVSVQKVHMKNIPPPKPVPVTGSPHKQAQRSTSPDVIFVGESPPPAPTPPTQKTLPKSAPPILAKPQAITNNIQTNASALTTIQPGAQQYIIRGNAIGNTMQGPLRLVPLNSMNQFQQRPPVPVQFQVPKQNTTAPHAPQRTTQAGMMSATSMLVNSAIMAKRHLESTQDSAGPAKKKLKKPGGPGDVMDNIGSWVPLDEYYYGKMEGDPSYHEDKGEFRFKCWYCSKMLYNNIKAMMHIQGHIDSGKQHNLDLSDLTQCKHCYKQFDTPFEMQTHVEKVHMNGANVLLCRICERDHESRTALTHHMRQNHTACEMPYICHLCNFRSSMYSDVVDHFKKKHDSSPHILCLYCLKVFKVKFVTLGWGQTQTYYGHLLKHQSKASTKKCTLCRLTFYNVPDVKAHKKKDHQANHKGVLGPNNRYSTPGQVMIKVPESGLQPKPQSVKSLNAPAVSKVLDFGGTRFPTVVNYLTCLECKMSMGTPDHFKKYIECSMCRFATSCSIAYANHMMGFHSCQVSSLNLNIPWERRMETPMYCLCGFGSRYGNKIANHLVYCTKRTCYLAKPDLPMSEEGYDEDADPRRKPGASILDVLGLVKKRTVTTKEEITNEIIRRPSWDEPPVLTNMNTEVTETPDSSLSQRAESEDIPPELTGMQKWTTVKIKDSATPSKASVFLGAEDMKMSEEEDDDMDVSLSDELKATLQNIVDDNIDESKPNSEKLDSENMTVTNRSDKKSGESELDEPGDNVVESVSISDETKTSENVVSEQETKASESLVDEPEKSPAKLSEDTSERSEVRKSNEETELLDDTPEIEGDGSKLNESFDSAIETKEKLKNEDVDNLDDKEIDELLKDENEDKISSKDEMEAVSDSKVSEEEENDLLGEAESGSETGKGDNSHNKGGNTDIEGKDNVNISSQGEEETTAASEGSHIQDKVSEDYTEKGNSTIEDIDSPEAEMDTIEYTRESEIEEKDLTEAKNDTVEDTIESEVCGKNSQEKDESISNEGENSSENTSTEKQPSPTQSQLPEMSLEGKGDKELPTSEQMETDPCPEETENNDLSEEKVEENSAPISEIENSNKEKDSSPKEKEDNSKDKGDNSATPKKEDNSQERGGIVSSEEKGNNSRSKGDNSYSEGRGDYSRSDDRRSGGDSYRQHSRDRDYHDDKDRSRNRDSRYDDRSSKSDYRDNRSQGNYRSHGDHHGDRSHDWDRNHGRSNKDDRNWRHSDSRNYHGNQDHHNHQGHRDNRNYHGNNQYSRDGRDDRRQGNYHDNYQSNRNHGNFRGGRGGYGNRGGYQGNYR